MDALAELAALEAADSSFRVTSGRPKPTSPRCCTWSARRRSTSWRRRRCRRRSARNQALDLPPPIDEAAVIAELRALAATQRAGKIADRHGLSRHAHAAVDPAQCAGEPGLVHRVHAVPGGDRAGPAGSAAELPDHDLRADGDGDRQRLAARRGDRRRRGHGDGARRQQDEVRRARGRRPICIRRPAPCWRPARGRSASGWSMSRRATSPRSARRSRSRWCCNIPAPPAPFATCRRRSRRRTKPTRW